MTDPTSDDPILIIGGGIGGLTAAAALAQRGLQVAVFERAEALRASGSGITVQINAARALGRLGLAEDVLEVGARVEAGLLRDERGRLISQMAMGPMEEAFGAPSIGVHRARLLEVLAEGARAAGAAIQTGAGLVDLEDHGDHVEAHLGGGGVHRGAALIGCDGLWSRVREILHGPADARYSGYATWRGIAPLPPTGATTEFWGPGLRFGLVPIGPRETYWFAVADAPPGGEDGEDVRAEMKARYAGWPAAVQEALDATPHDAILRTDCYDRPPLSSWGKGRVTLLGDAAHAMTPNLGQGACQAIEDALALADALATHPADTLAEGLRAYERARIERANWFVDRSWSMGRVAHAFKAAPLRRLRDAFMRWTPESVVASSLRTMFGEGASPT